VPNDGAMALMSSGRQVTITVTDEFAPRLDVLASSGHVWAVRTAATEEAAQQVWEEYPQQETDPLTTGLTLFKGGGRPERDLLLILDEMDLHHGISGGHIPPVSAIRVLGTGPTDAVREAHGLAWLHPSCGDSRWVRRLSP
jgi:hypothetical protein